MGCDGGTIPRRDELVRKKQKPEQKDKNSELSFKWQHCNITQLPLQTPIVACGLGKLYNKDAVIEMLLDKANAPESAKHIKSMKDIKELTLAVNPAYSKTAEKGDAYIDRQAAPYICPVIGLEMNGKFRFVFLWSCGCVMSERSLKAVNTKICHKCQKPFTDDDLVVLNGSDEDMELMKEKMVKRQVKVKAEKKSRVKNGTSTVVSTTTDNNIKLPSENVKIENQEQKQLKVGSNIKTENGGSTLATKGNGVINSEVQSLKRPSNSDIEDPLFKKTKGSYSVAKDPKASEVYKSLFTSHHKASQQTKAHWVTYNPFYN